MYNHEHEPDPDQYEIDELRAEDRFQRLKYQRQLAHPHPQDPDYEEDEEGEKDD